jgi:hypothetical protein
MAVADSSVRTSVVPSTVAYPPRITANRRQLDDRFPTLGFLIDAGSRPFFEVLLATDAALFNPANAARRAASNFYSSRQVGGLSPASAADHPYLVPTAILRAFANAAPRSRAIYYTLIAYADANGGDPAFALDPALLPRSAPSVGLAADFTGKTLATVLAVSVDKLRPFAAVALAPATPTAKEDAAEGEDGYGIVPPIAQHSAAPVQGVAAHQVASPTPPASPSLGFAQEGDFELAVLANPPVRPPFRRDVARVPDPLLPGHTRSRSSLDMALGEDYPADGQEPDYLQDDEDSESYIAQSLRAPALERHPAGYQSLDDTRTATATAAPLAVEDKMRIIDHIAPFESNGDYGAVNADGEFEGSFGKDHPAYQRYHVGLSYGLIQFTQDSGKLGELLAAMRQRDPAAFAEAFGPEGAELIRVTSAAGPPSSQSAGGRSARVQPVAGADLWREPWLGRFRAAARNENFKAAQREVAARGYLDPMLTFAGRLGLDSERALTIAVDRAVQMGPGGAKRWIISAVGPVASDAMRQQALAALGYSDVRSFQAGTPGLAADGEFGPETHAAIVAGLRRLGASSPIPVPTTEQMVDAMVRRAASEPWHARVGALQRLAMPDTRYQL